MHVLFGFVAYLLVIVMFAVQYAADVTSLRAVCNYS